SAVSSYVGTEVEAEVESIESASSSGGVSKEQQELRSRIRTRSRAAVKNVKSDGEYWEKIVASPLTPADASYRVFVHARVPRAEILRARLEKQAARQAKSGRRSV